jgi:hypothetical protein
MDCTPEVRHGNSCDSGFATVRYRGLLCASAASNSRGDRYPSADRPHVCLRTLALRFCEAENTLFIV